MPIFSKWHLKLLKKISSPSKNYQSRLTVAIILKTPTTIFSHFKSYILAAIDEIRQKKRRPDIDAIYEHILKSEAANADKNLIEMTIDEPTKQNVIINKKTCHGLDSFYKSSTAK